MYCNAAKLLVCPDCQGDLDGLGAPEKTSVFACRACRTLFPVIDDIPVLMHKAARRYDLEHPVLHEWFRSLEEPPPEWLDDLMQNTMAQLAARQHEKSWEWEDEEYWSQAYEKQTTKTDDRNWNERYWQREFLMRNLVRQSDLRGQTILDVGCGQGQNFRQLLLPHCDSQSLYVAADVSLAGLKLNRQLNPHRRALYVLCSADRLPFRASTIDLLCYFGILHHTERKEATMSEDSRLLRDGGHMIVHEALERPHLTPAFLKRHLVESAHEERIERDAFFSEIQRLSEMRIVCSRQMHTILLGGMMRILRWPMVRNRTFFSTVSTLDVACRQMLGNVVPFFRPGEVLLLLEKCGSRS